MIYRTRRGISGACASIPELSGKLWHKLIRHRTILLTGGRITSLSYLSACTPDGGP